MGKRILKIFLVALVLSVGAFWLIKSNDKIGYKVTNWDNIYNESNIELFYSNKDDVSLTTLDEVYKINEITKNEGSLHDRVLKIVDIVHSIVEFDDVKDTNLTSGYAILKEKNTAKKVSEKDMAIITRDFISSLGIEARVGEFRGQIGKINKEENYYVIEYWNNDFNKWVMIDFRDKGYFSNKKIPCSAIEVLEYELNDFSYSGKTEKKKHLSKFNKALDSYSIGIDNTVSRSKSNSYITYLYKGMESLGVEFKSSFIEPSIFTDEKYLFEKSPNDDIVLDDKKAYIILMKKYDKSLPKTKDEENTEEIKNDKVIVGAFQNGRIIPNYFVRVNDGEFEVAESYYEYNFIKGKNKIDISLDGVNVMSSVEILRNN